MGSLEAAAPFVGGGGKDWDEAEEEGREACSFLEDSADEGGTDPGLT